eukprot:CAMPEP_0185851496 /NCGR_PEP_ID=MMETSP1354-20130828/9993_1 /TAXON_ID=708628 /ORGANISM="Erythrolobus madagascarensis, Strain CCMP3276" /LENGTH=295 /DNA_ID=CAMNT_0028552495 /DNA_START=74 /DNA_END=961 /DNA_ORIENTATION=-
MAKDKVASVLSIAGSDSGGGAGVQADLKTFLARGVYGASVITALTAQNSRGVTGILATPAEFVEKQLDAVLSDIRVDAIKTGMLANKQVIHTVARTIRSSFPNADSRPPLVVDPVLIATSGDSLLADDAERSEAIQILTQELLPMATVVTPNLSEAATLLGRDVLSTEDMRVAAHDLCEKFLCAHAVVKGGHSTSANGSDSDACIDVLYSRQNEHFEAFSLPRLSDASCSHGTGCTLAAAIAAELAKKRPIAEAVLEAKSYVYQAMSNGVYPVSHTPPHTGALNHGVNLSTPKFS